MIQVGAIIVSGYAIAAIFGGAVRAWTERMVLSAVEQFLVEYPGREAAAKEALRQNGFPHLAERDFGHDPR